MVKNRTNKPFGTESIHPGLRIKAEVIPNGMSVTHAAKLIGVGRVALSNLLNGNAALSSDMATRIEKAFKTPRRELLEMQASYEMTLARIKNAPANTKTYVPPYLQIKGNNIQQWATLLGARSRLPVLVRTLVHSTGHGLISVDFPGNDDAERSGWDGLVEAGEGTPWVPAGRSGWELGTTADPKRKATDDFAKRTKSTTPEERADTTFVFVTPRRWTSKGSWVDQARKKGRWKDVRAYDSSDLEQWLEQSLPAQAWFANETELPSDGVRSLDRCWRDWADVAVPPLPGSLFDSAIDQGTKSKMLSRLAAPPDGEPIVVAADSIDEALAFLAQLFGERGGAELAAHRDRILIFDSPGVLKRLAHGAQSFIPVVVTREVERELAPHVRAMHSIVVYPRNAVNVTPSIILEPARHETFDRALQEMGKNRDDVARLANESGRSLTVLRRRLATVQAVRTPEWAADHERGAKLVPFLFVGAWNSANESDTRALSTLAGGQSYAELEKEFQQFTHLNNAPSWSIGTHRGVISKIDLLYAIAAEITQQDLARYFSVARQVLGEDDPALDLREDQRWAAALHGKSRRYSEMFREGICETLVLLAVHGAHLFRARLGVDTEVQAALVVRDLLPTPLTTRVLQANDGNLPAYAEAAPDEFLSILERDLRTQQPAVLGLLQPVPGLFGYPSRSGLLWALEILSWSPTTLTRAALVLARLAQVEINDNWVNKPINSLAAVFRAWMPQTEASHDERVALMKKLAERFPQVAWKLCLAQFGGQYGIGSYSSKPRWRRDGHGFGEPLTTWNPVDAFARAMVDLALEWREHTLTTLGDLVDQLHRLGDEYQSSVWLLIERWATEKASDEEKASLREKIRTAVLSRRAVMRATSTEETTTLTAKARSVLSMLEPKDLLNRHAWLFREPWVEESADELEDLENFDYEKQAQRIAELRVEAMREVEAARGLEGLLVLAERGKASWQMGLLATKALPNPDALQDLLQLAFRRILNEADATYALRNLISAALLAVAADGDRQALLKKLGAKLQEEEELARLLVLAPFARSTWGLVDELGDAAQGKYWHDVAPDRFRNDGEYNDGVERLLRAGRPRAAFSCVGVQASKLDDQVLFRLLSDVAKGGRDEPGQYLLEEHDVTTAFKHLTSVSALTLEQKAVLELAFLDALTGRSMTGSDSAIPNLERYLESHPELYVTAIAWAYKRKDDGVDPAEVRVPPERRLAMAERGHKLLTTFARVPGRDTVGHIDTGRLTQWVDAVRKSCAVLSRGEIADGCLGKLLAHSPIGEDGVWPCEPVRQLVEDLESEDVTTGMHIGVYKSLGMRVRGEGGAQERLWAAKYRKWGDALRFSHPFVSAKLLMDLAETFEHEGSREDSEAGIRRRRR